MYKYFHFDYGKSLFKFFINILFSTTVTFFAINYVSFYKKA
jgi:hypothetical protein